MQTMPEQSVNLIAVDPPYYKVKGEAWDRQWDTADGFLAWIAALRDEWFRLLKPNGSLYCFASPKMAARVEVCLAERFNVLNRIVWSKASTPTHALKYGDDRFRQYVQKSEFLIFCEHYGADSSALGVSGYGAKCDELRGFVFEPLRAYLDGERRRAGVLKPMVDSAWCVWKGVNQTAQSQKWFSRSCWNLPTCEAFDWLRRLFNEHGRRPAPPWGDFHDAPPERFGHTVPAEYLRADYEYLRADYEDLRADYEDLRADYEDLRRPFTVTADVPYTDVWDFPTVGAYRGKHPCEKPLAMMEHIVNVSSRPGDVVLDCCCGSGTTLLAAKNLGRRYIGTDTDAKHIRVAEARLAANLVRDPPVACGQPEPVAAGPRTLF